MDYEEIKKLIDDMGNAKIDELEIEFPEGMKISMKKILKWWILGVYYGTAPCMIPVFGYCLIYGIKTKRNKFLL